MKLFAIFITNTATVYGGAQPLRQAVLFVFVPFDKNTLGDIIAIRDESGDIVARYVYDAWGNQTVMDGYGYVNTSSSFIGNINPFRYRGYYYDNETGFYYLQTRYYDPTICRFINADDYELVAELSCVPGQLNMYAYCNNNPIMFTDPTGTSWWSDIMDFIADIQKDIANFDINNTDPQNVIEANYFSAYKGQLAVKLPIGDNAFSFGIMVIGDDVTSYNTIRHEYGHYLQLQEMGWGDFIINVAIPSVTGFILEEQGKLQYPYLSLPWEYDASLRGGDTIIKGIKPIHYLTYWDLLKMF